MTDLNGKENRLAGEKSPYLLQHARNPVDWFPWGVEAFEKAAAEDKPVFLSIGYSTCHWCHVMEADSFENAKVAEILNGNFISIKVDREERPDIDAVYMKACQAMSGSGGWPLTIIMSPDKKPFFAATFIPAENSYGRKGLKNLLNETAEAWRSDRDRMLQFAERAAQFLGAEDPAAPAAAIDASTLDAAYETLKDSFDEEYGGFGDEPKFPSPHTMSFLLGYWKRTGEEDALLMAEATLSRIAAGGIHDHVGGGYHRYSTDRRWLVPHFEKMLYDQALLARAFTQAYQATGKTEYAVAARDIFDYVLRGMTGPHGGFYSAEDADSEGREGKFYVWTKAEITAALGAGDAKIFDTFYGITEHGNFEDGTNIPSVVRTVEALGDELGIGRDEINASLERARKTLFEARNKRIKPLLDDKIITSWNALMISSLALGGRALGEPEYIRAAGKAADFILFNMHSGGQLFRRWRDGQAAVPGFLDDYAFLANALVDLYEAEFDTHRLEQAIALAGEMLKLFGDETRGGFFLSPRGGERMIAPVKDAYDGAEPSGNSIAALALARLAKFTGSKEFEDAARGTVAALAPRVKKYPPGFTQLLIAAGFLLGPSAEIAIAGGAGDPLALELLKVVNTEFLPDAVLAFVPLGVQGSRIRELAPFAKDKALTDGKAAAFVCRNYSCELPVTEPEKLKRQLSHLKR